MGLKMGAGSSTAEAGELQVISIIASSAPGLSPLMRGTPASGVKSHRRCRFIPAGAGNSRGIMFTVMRPPVYPRWRGELIVHINNRGEFNGLSPLARGTHYGPGKKRAGGRFIPAGAGNSGRLALQPAPAAVYPRWRGELKLAGNLFRGESGLSPLARGTL